MLIACSGPPEVSEPSEILLHDPGKSGPAPAVVTQAGFTDITIWAGAGLDGRQAGASLVDIDGDGFDDLLIPHEHWLVVLKNRGDGSFFIRNAVSLPDEPHAFYVAELTGDNHDDVLALTYESEFLLAGDGTGHFSEAVPFGPPGSDGQPSVATMGDFDGDGRLDVYLGRLIQLEEDDYGQDDGENVGSLQCQQLNPKRVRSAKADEAALYSRHDYFSGIPPGNDRLLLSRGGWHSAELEHVDELYTQAAAVVDMDGDGALDIFVGTEGLRRDIVYRANGDGSFKAEYIFPEDARTSAMGFDAVDLDGDGTLELYVADDGAKGDRIFRWNGESYSLVSESLGFAATAWLSAWGGGFFDWDHDGDRDFFAANGVPLGEGCPGGAQPNILMLNDGLSFFDVFDAAPGGLDGVFNSRAALFSDIDHDGDIDVFIQNVDGPPRLLRNDFDKVGHWLQVRLVHPTLSPAIGSKLEVYRTNVHLRRDVIGTPSFGGSSSQWLHFGISDDGPVDLKVTWPDGTSQLHRSVALDQFVTLYFDGSYAERPR